MSSPSSTETRPTTSYPPSTGALHREGISEVRVERIRCTDSRRLLGVTTPTSTLQDLLRHRDMALKAARLANSCITDLVPQQKWRWIRIHGISLTRYMGGARDGGLRKLREELEAENSWMHIPVGIRWLGGAKVRARFQKEKDGSSSVVAAVLGEATFGRLCKSGVRLFGRRYEVDAFEEAWRADAFCSRCSEWKHISPHCLAAAPRCPLREGPPHDRPPVPLRGLQGGEGPPVSTRGGKVRKLRRISWGASRCLCCQEGGPDRMCFLFFFSFVLFALSSCFLWRLWGGVAGTPIGQVHMWRLSVRNLFACL